MNNKKLSIAILASLAAGPAMAASLSSMKWNHRPVLVFAEGDGDPQVAQQRTAFAIASKDLQDRQIAVIYVLGEQSTSSDSASRLRAKYGVRPDEFRVVLIGKDGGVKRTSRRPLSVDELSSTIDAMPMRKQEVRKGS